MGDDNFNIDSGHVDQDLQDNLKRDAIGSTLYSKTWVLQTLKKMSLSRSYDKFLELSKEAESDLMSDIDSILGMSADKDVAVFLVEESCFSMLAAELLLPNPFGPSGAGKGQEISVEFQSHCFRRQELCLVTLGNIVLRKGAVLGLLSALKVESTATYLVDLPFAVCGFTLENKDFYLEMLQEGSSQIQEFSSVLEAFFRYQRSLLTTLNNSLVDEKAYGEEDPTADLQVQALSLKTFKLISDEVSIDSLALILATSSNKSLLTNVSKFLFCLIEFVSDLGFFSDVNVDTFFCKCLTSGNFLSGYVEAIKQSGKSDWSTCILFVQVLSDILVRFDIVGRQITDTNLDHVSGSICEVLTELVKRSPLENPMNSDKSIAESCLKDCAVISKSLHVIWTHFKHFHYPSFEALAEFLMAVSRSNFSACTRGDGDVDSVALFATISDAVRGFCDIFPKYNGKKTFIQVSEFLREGNGPEPYKPSKL